jgi:serine/threonine-protein kinase
MADVYLAMLEGPSGFSKLLVVKELRDESHEDDIGVQMFLDEARVAARLNHPNIVQTLEVGSDEGRCFLAMEYLDGQSLRRVIHRASAANTPLPLQTHLRILVDVLSALDYAHSLREFDGTPLGIVHRDVSPQNVILTYEGHVKLIDFGIAKTVLASAETREGIVKGKVKYMPPEQATGQPVDARTDVFAVGVLLWEALAGRGPWHGESDVAIFRSLMSGVVPRLSHVRPGLHPDLVAIVDRAVSADPRERYPTAAAMRDELESRIVASHGPPATLRDLPTLLCTLFERERRELRIQIDAWIRRPESRASGASTHQSYPCPDRNDRGDADADDFEARDPAEGVRLADSAPPEREPSPEIQAGGGRGRGHGRRCSGGLLLERADGSRGDVRRARTAPAHVERATLVGDVHCRRRGSAFVACGGSRVALVGASLRG